MLERLPVEVLIFFSLACWCLDVNDFSMVLEMAVFDSETCGVLALLMKPVVELSLVMVNLDNFPREFVCVEEELKDFLGCLFLP